MDFSDWKKVKKLTKQIPSPIDGEAKFIRAVEMVKIHLDKCDHYNIWIRLFLPDLDNKIYELLHYKPTKESLEKTEKILKSLK